MKLSKRKRAAIRALVALKELHVLHFQYLRRLRPKPECWVNPFLSKHQMFNIEQHLLQDLLWGDGCDFKSFSRMTISDFEGLLLLVEPAIKKEDTNIRYAISARVRLAVTLRFIASGESYRSLEFLCRISRKTIGNFVPEVLEAIYDALEKQYWTIPSTSDDWKQISKDFEKIWNFPHILGATDGKHIRIKAPEHSGSDFYNNKGFFSIVLLAIADAHCKFIYIDVGANGRASDNVVFKTSEFYGAIKSNKLNFPPQEILPGSSINLPYFLIGGDIFGLDRNLMKAYNRNVALSKKQQIFNYRLSRARMSVEMAFGRLASRFRIFHRPIDVKLDTADKIVKTCCVLHNYLSKLITRAPPMESQSELCDLPNTFTPLGTQHCEQSYKYACRIRDNLANYFVTVAVNSDQSHCI